MANPTTNVNRSEPTQQEQEEKVIENLRQVMATHGDAIQSLLVLAKDLHDSGLLEILHGVLQAKEQVASIALEQILKPSVLNTLRNVMSALEMVSKINPDQLNSLTDALVSGLQRAQDQLHSGKRVGLFDLVKVLRNPDTNRTLALMLGLIQGIGEKL